MRLIGIDEAGRGPVLGPMAMAVVVLTEEQEKELARFGVTDSKKFGSTKRGKGRRKYLADLIQEGSLRHRVALISPEKIDQCVASIGLNVMEREVARKLLHWVGATTEDKIVCDGKNLFGGLRDTWPDLIAENKADLNHVSVAAASILAKVARDNAFGEIQETYKAEFGEILGGGYPNAKTQVFLDAYRLKYGSLPSEARKTWGRRSKA